MSETFIKIDSLKQIRNFKTNPDPTNLSKICVTTFTVLTSY